MDFSINAGDTVVAVKERTFNSITIYGIGTYEADGYVHINGNKIIPEQIIPASLWQDIVDETCATVNVLESFCFNE